MRITPRITPHIPSPRNISPSSLARSAPRAVLTGNIPHPRLGGLGGLSGLSTVKAAKPKLAMLTQGSHTGRARKANPKPKTPAQLTGVKTSAHYQAPRSMAAQRPGVRTITGAKRKVKQANPFRLPHL